MLFNLTENGRNFNGCKSNVLAFYIQTNCDVTTSQQIFSQFNQIRAVWCAYVVEKCVCFFGFVRNYTVRLSAYVFKLVYYFSWRCDETISHVSVFFSVSRHVERVRASNAVRGKQPKHVSWNRWETIGPLLHTARECYRAS